MTRHEVNELDEIWARLVKDKAQWTCEHCGVRGVRMEAAHVVGRRHRATRWGCFNCENNEDDNTRAIRSWPQWKQDVAKQMFGTELGPEKKKYFYDLGGHCLCHVCHQQYDEHGPREWAIVQKTIGPERKERLQQIAQSLVAKHQDFDQIKLILESLGGY